jgi:CBS domain-containing protein
MKLLDPIRELLARQGRDFWSVAPNAPVLEAILRMSRASVEVLLVFDSGKLAGIISEGDYARKVVLEGRSPRETLVREIMTTALISVSPTATVDECMQCMTDRRIRHLPVLEGRTVVGLISMSDLVQWVVSEQEGRFEERNNYARGRYSA